LTSKKSIQTDIGKTGNELSQAFSSPKVGNLVRPTAIAGTTRPDWRLDVNTAEPFEREERSILRIDQTRDFSSIYLDYCLARKWKPAA
jgi:hypothetical protein